MFVSDKPTCTTNSLTALVTSSSLSCQIQDPRHVNRLPAGVHELTRRVLHSNFRELPTSMHFADAVVSTPANTFQPFPRPGT